MEFANPPRRTCDVVIVGGGIIGLASGWRLACAGLSVVVVERGRAGQAASRAAAGMLAPNAEAEPEDREFLHLTRRGLEMWPAFARELQEITGIDVELRTDGITMAARGPQEAARLKGGLDARRRSGAPVEWLDADALRSVEPGVADDLSGALFFSGDGQVNNPRATMALARAFVGAGGSLLEGTPARDLVLRNGRATGILTDAGVIDAGVTILAAGAWTGSLPGWPPEALPPVLPIKGQMLALKSPRPAVRRVLWGVPDPAAIYLVPRSNGRLIVGATVEQAGFDTRLTADGIRSLLAAATRLVPALGEAVIADLWAGLRPGSPDGAPVVGPAPIEGLVWATGHHRNGILMAPLTADAVCRLVIEDHWPSDYDAMGSCRTALTQGNTAQKDKRVSVL